MRHISISSLASTALLLCLASPAFAQDTVSITQTNQLNIANVTQTLGQDGKAIIVQNGKSGDVELDQRDHGGSGNAREGLNGVANLASITQGGAGNGVNTKTALLGGQAGQTNTQAGGAINLAYISQAGTGNVTNFKQEGSGYTLHVTQGGASNKIDAIQSPAGFGVPGLVLGLNDANVTADLLQAGTSNSMYVQQVGTSESVVETQGGSLNQSETEQFGLDETAAINQTGAGGFLYVTQTGKTDSVDLSQSGSANDLHVNQNGNQETATVTQSGTKGLVMIAQNFWPSSTTIAQGGVSNTANVHQ